jgi:hypothetical protein
LSVVSLGIALYSFTVGSIATGEDSARYPYDPACAWGRLADGHGMLLRCLGPAEAQQLLAADAPPPAAGATTSAGKSAGVSSAPAAPPAASSGPIAAGSASTAAAGPAGSGRPSAPPLDGRVTVTSIGPAQADTGELPLAGSKLEAAKDRFVECVGKQGGMQAQRARIVLRFLVRERGRAEGVEVKSVNGVTEAAAECIADVVDRRYVGYPAAPIVGATLPIELGLVR